MMLLAAALWLAGCASLPHDVERPVSTALSDAGSASALGRLAQAAAPSAEVSGFRLIPSGEAAYATLLTLADRAERTLDLRYYIIDSDSVVRELMRHVLAAAARGVRVRVLTNSLAATDAPIVHVGYAKYRDALLRSGVELYELRPVLGQRSRALGTFASSQASLHVKSVIVDRSTLFVGSMNIDPRSVGLNTESGLIIRSPVLAQAVAGLFDDTVRDSAYHVTEADGRLRWTTQETAGKPCTTASPMLAPAGACGSTCWRPLRPKSCSSRRAGRNGQ
ncbi:phospholipase D-like domain-containing protein [Ralstonia solanacearum]|uniref:phospholipase D-like domain-containing protein n=1 Tax=Ralstonia solanacearum TaxID=305 RepID=UPI003CC6D550